jgi:hypothetical protein
MRLIVSLLALSLALPAFAVTPRELQGKPEFTPGKKTGMFLWKDPEGYHVRFTSKKNKPQTFEGKVCVPDGEISVTPFKLDDNDSLEVGPKGHCAKFTFVVGEGVDGFDFKNPRSPIELDVQYNGKSIKKGKIFAGAEGKHPKVKGAFTIERAAAD